MMIILNNIYNVYVYMNLGKKITEKNNRKKKINKEKKIIRKKYPIYIYILLILNHFFCTHGYY